MPVFEKSPFIAEWNAISDDGEPIVRELRPDDILEAILNGYTPEEISEEFDAPIEAIEHVIACIPDMMAWRRMYSKMHPYKKLPKIVGAD